MGRFSMVIDCDNDAFTDDGMELRRLIRKVSQTVLDGDTPDGCVLLDYNGNTVGHWKVEASETEPDRESSDSERPRLLLVSG